jgi:hypothetical protein
VLSDVVGRKYVVLLFGGFLLPRGVSFGVVVCAREFFERFVMLLLTLVW